MPTNKKQFSMVVDDDFLTMIDDYRFSHRLKSRNSAINELVQKGMTQVLAEMGKEKTPDELPPEVRMFSPDAIAADPFSAFVAVLDRAGLIRDGDISDQDAAFLTAIFDAMNAYFQKPKKGRK